MMARQNVIGGGMNTARVPRRQGDYHGLNGATVTLSHDEEQQAATQAKARAQLEAFALEAHPLPDKNPDAPQSVEAYEKARDVAGAYMRELCEALDLLIPTSTRRPGVCDGCGKTRSIADASPHTANPAGLGTACRRAAAKTTPTTTEGEPA